VGIRNNATFHQNAAESEPIVVEVEGSAFEFNSPQYIPEVEELPDPTTAIVRHIGDLEFRLPSEDLSGAMAARITLTELARKLGYSSRERLKELAERHETELSELGDTLTVSLSVKCGFSYRLVEEPVYLVEQATYLALASETPQGRASRVGIIKAYKELLAEFERVVAQPAGIDPALTQLLTQQSQMMGGIMQGLTNLTLAIATKGRRKQPAIPVPPAQLPLESPDRGSHWAADAERSKAGPQSSELVRIAEQDQLTERKVISAMIKRLAGVTTNMETVEYGARMSTAFHEIENRLKAHGHDSKEEFAACRRDGRKMNTLDWFERIGVLGLVRQIIEQLHKEKLASGKR
jgi:hypothetical protein